MAITIGTPTKVQNSTGDTKGMYYVRDKNFVEYPMLGVMYRNIVSENPVYTGEIYRNEFTDLNGNPFIIPQIDVTGTDAPIGALAAATTLPGQVGSGQYGGSSPITVGLWLSDSMKGVAPNPLITTQSFFVYYNGDPAGTGQECGRISVDDFESEGNVSANLIGG